MPDQVLRPSTNVDRPTVVRNAPLVIGRNDWPGMHMRWIFRPDDKGWSDFALSEWELAEAGWSDVHTHTETNVVLAGELYVECAGHTVVAHEGDTVTVPAGLIGRYWAPVYARMFAIYGPNPRGHPHSESGTYWHVERPSE